MAKTLEQKLCSRSLGYSFVRNVIVGPALCLYYRKVDVIDAKTVPNQGPVIFTPNHQNALMDALSILCTKDRQSVFIARADIFQKPLIVAILHFLRILPVFRKRDGGNSFDNNQETFDLILKVLHSQQAVGVMPEGTHNEVKRLRVLQKGVFRLAMQAQEKYGTQPMVKIVPVGLEYSNTSKFHSNLMVRYGKAIEMSDFYDLYVENQAKAFKVLQDTLSEKMKEGMIHIENEEHYNEIERLRVIYQKRALQRLGLDGRKAGDCLLAQQKTVATMQECLHKDQMEISVVCAMTKEYVELLEKYDLRDWVIERQPYSLAGLLGRCLLMLPGIPFWVLGMVFNYLPYKLSALSSRKVKDPQFVSSVQFVAGMVLFQIYYLAMIILSVIFIPCIWGKITVPLLMIPLGLFAYRFYLAGKKLNARFRFWAGMRKYGTKLGHAIDLRKGIFEMMENVEI